MNKYILYLINLLFTYLPPNLNMYLLLNTVKAHPEDLKLHLAKGIHLLVIRSNFSKVSKDELSSCLSNPPHT